MSVQMKLGWWMDRKGVMRYVSKFDELLPFPYADANGGKWMANGRCREAYETESDLVKFIKPIDSQAANSDSGVKMRLGWWRARDGSEHEVVRQWDDSYTYPWTSLGLKSWNDEGRYLGNDKESHLDLIEFLRPLDTELPPALNTAVKAAEDRVRAWKTHHAAAQKLADDALFILEEAKRELQRLEKECEVGK